MRLAWDSKNLCECIFHKWVKQDDGMVYALVEYLTGTCNLVPFDYIVFADTNEAYSEIFKLEEENRRNYHD